MPTLTQAASQADVVKFQIDPNYTNEAITLLLGTNYKSGSVLGKITATGKYKLAVVGAVDGSAVAVAVLLNPADATAADATGVILARGPAIVSKVALVFDATVNTVPLTATKWAELTAVGIVPDLPPGRPSFITRVWLVDSRRFRVGQARRVRAECVGDAKWFTEKSTAYAKDRQVFGRAIGQNQGVQFPIARA